MTESHPTMRLYLVVYAALVALLALTVWVATVDLGAWGAPTAMAIACLKTALVVLYFMHVRWSERMVAIAATTAVMFFLLLTGMTVAEFFTRG